MEKKKILIVEDDQDIREAVSLLLQTENFNVVEAYDGNNALEKIDTSFDLVILDVMMPGITGFVTCQKIREISNVPVIFLTAKSTEADKLKGLMSGGDDYLVKPFSFNELIARVNALIRRYSVYKGKNEANNHTSNIINYQDMVIDKNISEVMVKGKVVELTDLEYRILLLLAESPKVVFSAKKIYETVWNEPFLYTSNSTIMVHIRKLRIKIEENPDEPKHIKTIWGKGYRFE